MRISDYLKGDPQKAPVPEYGTRLEKIREAEMYKSVIDHAIKRYAQHEIGVSLIDSFTKALNVQPEEVIQGVFSGLPKSNIVKKFISKLI